MTSSHRPASVFAMPLAQFLITCSQLRQNKFLANSSLTATIFAAVIYAAATLLRSVGQLTATYLQQPTLPTGGPEAKEAQQAKLSSTTTATPVVVFAVAAVGQV